MLFVVFPLLLFFSFFFNDTATTEIYTGEDTLSLHDALPIFPFTTATKIIENSKEKTTNNIQGNSHKVNS